MTTPTGVGTAPAKTLTTAASVSSGWVINAVVAEGVIRRPATRGAGRRSRSTGGR
ncbi:hypothetical protein [Georgenia muralis]|uniref:hypothetical protein n=1 Tax=Georgenia muralis TaxID=154117 RepID=UPI001B87E5C8|nr:hypothetical protein [Georgenia muralis]